MSCIVYITNKKTNTKYAYRSDSYRDPVTKQPKSKRTYLGRVDPITNEIIPKAEKGKRNRKPVNESSPERELPPKPCIPALKEQFQNLVKLQRDIKQEIAVMDDLIGSIQKLLDQELA